MKTGITNIKYRSDIDGLRAIAVVGVLIYHAFPLVLPGGFTGVDIFFVISGYLISGILYRGHSEGNFSFKNFYARRIRRLFPALITVLVLSLGYGWLIMLPDEFRQLGKHVAAGTLFLQNFVFWNESGYFDTAANLKPLLHLWSLAVEEQFYIFFPPILILLWKKPKFLPWGLTILLIFSFSGNMIMSSQNRVSDFFLTPYRTWEFLVGGLLAWWHFCKHLEGDIPTHQNLMSCGGLLLLGLGMVYVHKGDDYPGWKALLPVVGTVMLVESGKGAWINSAILSNPLMVWIGLISYPLYLFHWPALSFVNIVKLGHPTVSNIWAALGIAVLLAIITNSFLEKRIRYNKSNIIIPMLCGIYILIGFMGFLVQIGCIKSRLHTYDASFDNRGIPKWVEIKKDVFYTKIGGNAHQTLFVGDSNMKMYLPRVWRLCHNNYEQDRGAKFIISYGTPPIKGYESDRFKGCGKLIPELEHILSEDTRIDRVVLGACWISYFDNQDKNDIFHYSYRGLNPENPEVRIQVINELGNMIRKISSKGIKVYIVLNTPAGQELGDVILIRNFISTKYTEKNISIDGFNKRYKVILDSIREIGCKYGAEIIDPIPSLTQNGMIILMDKNGPIRKDGYHLLEEYVQEKVTYIDQTIKD